VQSLAPTKKTVVTGLAGLPIGKESISLKAVCPPTALPVPTMKRIVTGKCRTAGGQEVERLRLRLKAFSTLTPETASPGVS